LSYCRFWADSREMQALSSGCGPTALGSELELNGYKAGRQRPDHGTKWRGGEGGWVAEPWTFFEKVVSSRRRVCKKTGPGPSQTRKKVLPPTFQSSFNKITNYEKANKSAREMVPKETPNGVKTHVEGPLHSGKRFKPLAKGSKRFRFRANLGNRFGQVHTRTVLNPVHIRLPSGSREILPWRPILVFVGRSRGLHGKFTSFWA